MTGSAGDGERPVAYPGRTRALAGIHRCGDAAEAAGSGVPAAHFISIACVRLQSLVDATQRAPERALPGGGDLATRDGLLVFWR